jgi:hypothetical protein
MIAPILPWLWLAAATALRPRPQLGRLPPRRRNRPRPLRLHPRNRISRPRRLRTPMSAWTAAWNC